MCVHDVCLSHEHNSKLDCTLTGRTAFQDNRPTRQGKRRRSSCRRWYSRRTSTYSLILHMKGLSLTEECHLCSTVFHLIRFHTIVSIYPTVFSTNSRSSRSEEQTSELQ